ncbi:glutaredoxin domain-containing protein [Thiohalorhabdus sp.]|uniref:glutaredoxin domain-containing protein n=1 Tax=Thiohalorhabdus sp. TaxID=3094134 RepID=UPI002FC2F367
MPQGPRDFVLAAGLLVTLAFLAAGTAEAEIYKWVDEADRVHYSDKPNGGDQAKEVETKALSSYKSPKIRETSLEDRRPNGNGGKPHVTMYSAEWCGYCDKARNYFQKNNIPFTEYDVENSKKGRRDYKRMGEDGVPVILVGHRKMRGFSPDSFRKLYRSQKTR